MLMIDFFSANLCKMIRITCLCDVNPILPHFYIVKLGFTGVYLFFLILIQNIDCGYLFELPRQGHILHKKYTIFQQR